MLLHNIIILSHSFCDTKKATGVGHQNNPSHMFVIEFPDYTIIEASRFSGRNIIPFHFYIIHYSLNIKNMRPTYFHSKEDG